MRFCLYQRKWGNDYIFLKNNFENLKKLQSIVNIFVFFIKILCQRITPFLNNPPFSPTSLFLEKIFHPREVNPPPIYKGSEVRTMPQEDWPDLRKPKTNKNQKFSELAPASISVR